MREVELDTVEARGDCALGRISEQRREHARQLGDVRQLNIGDALAITAFEIIELAR